MITKIRHAGIYVNKKYFKETKEFYISLGFEEEICGEECWPFFGEILFSKLKTKTGELLEIVGDEFDHKYEGSHVALQCSSISDIYDSLKNKCIFFIKPMLSPDGSAKVAFCWDPNGHILELVEVLV